MHGKYIKRIEELTQQANKDISDIKTNHKKDITTKELENLKKSLESIQNENSVTSRNLRAWDAPLPRSPIPDQEGITTPTSTKDSGYPSTSAINTITKDTGNNPNGANITAPQSIHQ